MRKKCLVSFSCMGRENYNRAQLRLIRSFVETGWNGHYLLRSTDSYVDEHLGVKIELGSLPKNEKYGLCFNHFEVPYLFKAFLIQEAIEKGYEKIIWCDSTIVKVGNLDSLFDHAEQHGICAFDNLGHPLKFWIHDAAMSTLGIDVNELENMKQIMACAIVFDFTHPTAREIFNLWIQRGLDGISFNMRDYKSDRDGWRGHPGDQPIISALLNIYGIPLLPYGQLCYEPHDETKEYGEPLLVNKGIK